MMRNLEAKLGTTSRAISVKWKEYKRQLKHHFHTPTQTGGDTLLSAKWDWTWVDRPHNHLLPLNSCVTSSRWCRRTSQQKEIFTMKQIFSQCKSS